MLLFKKLARGMISNFYFSWQDIFIRVILISNKKYPGCGLYFMFSAHFLTYVYSKETLFTSVATLHSIVNNDLYMLLEKH